MPSRRWGSAGASFFSNHTTLTDWIYLWILAYLSRDGDHSASLFISLNSRAISSSCLANGSLSVAHLRAIKMKPKS
jgi:hypothetical protein